MIKVFVGDRVRLLHSSEEGIITKFLNDKVALVAIDNDFEIEVLIKELAPIAREERKLSNNPSKTEISKSSSTVVGATQTQALSLNQAQGIFLVISPVGSGLDFFLFNNSSVEVLFGLYAKNNNCKQKDELKGLESGILKKGGSVKVYRSTFELIDQWPEFFYELIFYSGDYHIHRKIFSGNVKLKSKQFTKPQMQIRGFNTPGWMYRLDENVVEKVEAVVISGKDQPLPPPEKPKITVARPDDVIDLHIEKLAENYTRLNAAEMLALQLKTITKALDAGVVYKMRKITFIHGVGNGILKNEILNLARAHSGVKETTEASLLKYGKGATDVVFH